jgi:hypothetical protein
MKPRPIEVDTTLQAISGPPPILLNQSRTVSFSSNFEHRSDSSVLELQGVRCRIEIHFGTPSGLNRCNRRAQRKWVYHRGSIKCSGLGLSNAISLGLSIMPTERVEHQRRILARQLLVAIWGGKCKNTIVRVKPKKSGIREGRPPALGHMLSGRPAQ